MKPADAIRNSKELLESSSASEELAEFIFDLAHEHASPDRLARAAELAKQLLGLRNCTPALKNICNAVVEASSLHADQNA